MNTWMDTNSRLARYFGIESKNVTGFDIKVRAGDYPQVTVYKFVPDTCETETKHYKLTPVDELNGGVA